MWPKNIFLIACLINCAVSNPIIIRSGIVKEHAKHENGNVQEASLDKGKSGFENEDGYKEEDQKKFVGAEDSGSYLHRDEDKKIKHDQGGYNDQAFHEQGEGSIADAENKKGHSKGHQKTGFHNTYHKDESGSNSSYFDNGKDEGGDYQHNTKRGNAGNSAARRNQGSYLDGTHYEKDDGKQGSFNNKGHYDGSQGNKKNYKQGQRYDEGFRQGHSNVANQFGEGGNNVVEKQQSPPYYHHHQPHDPHYQEAPAYVEKKPFVKNIPYYPEENYYEQPAPYNVPEKKIIIYEDPRVYDNNVRFSNYEQPYENQRIQLDVRPPVNYPNRYYDERPVYEDYYY